MVHIAINPNSNQNTKDLTDHLTKLGKKFSIIEDSNDPNSKFSPPQICVELNSMDEADKLMVNFPEDDYFEVS